VIRALQQKLVSLGYAYRGTGERVPPASWATDGWSDGLFERETAQAVERFQRQHMPGTQYYGQVWGDDWAKLWSL
jgi:peptidoglycan hydrolase-like protein with peptidoglycan-binding domain